MRILIFNPENDLALASNDPHYTPPISARQMAADLQDLPRLWAEEGDVIVQPQTLPLPSGHGRKRSPSTDEEICNCLIHSTPSLTGREGRESSLLPWGWSPLIVRQLREGGVPDSLLPTQEQMKEYRNFASREQAVRLLKKLRRQWPAPFRCGTLAGESVWCKSETEVLCAIARYGGSAMLKAPWSGSGRGVHPVHEQPLQIQALSWVRRTLQTQGGVEVEPLYDKVQDLAMEFWTDGGRVRYEGLSLFQTTAGGVYAGNLVATEQEKEARLAALLPLTLLHEVREHIVNLLNESGLPTWYTGPLGVDMMIVKPCYLSPVNRQASSVILHPLVELNLRMTMGWVALQLTSRLKDGETGTFTIGFQDGRYQALFKQNAATDTKKEK